MAVPLVMLGEVRTCLLPSAAALTRAEAGELLALMPGCAVRWRERPGKLAISPTVAVGVDCNLPLGEQVAHVVGTVATSIVLAGGRVLQSSASTRVVRASEKRRQTWSHYVSQKGVTEVISRIPERATAGIALAEGYLTGPVGGDILDLASISERLLSRIRADVGLDHDPPVRARTTRLRWTARIGGTAGPTAELHLDDDSVRSIRLIVRAESDLDAAQRFCEDLAAHDWLLTVLADALDEADRFPSHSRERMNTLAPALEHLTGLWMPGGHTPAELRALWKELQTEPGFSRQWTTLVARLRDNIAVATLAALRHKVFDSDSQSEPVSH
ncbi:SCO2521 family protein [Nocardia sp. NBC_00565]|uniref:SCO2521 family protein n=1 Tax=Nocardia sp. NBC_00565 TaxID=2975993 RepID=UPI002E80403F|nr:SCO2521 family protein [Nocardia sp. NBC_00565]WUC00537.1 SCO2521 family protein [Nocardia sp. NBC_00565]